jgi:hypothetical protein
MMNNSADCAILKVNEGAKRVSGRAARLATILVLALGWVAAMAIAWPGQLSYDSIVQLLDGRSAFYHSWHPPAMAWLLGLFDAVLPGTGLFVVFDSLLLVAALVSLVWMGARASWAAVAAALMIVLMPQFLLYQGIVWKDVLFANAAVAGFVCLAQCEARWGRHRARLILAALAAALFVLAMLVRQNGAIVAILGALAFGTIAARAEGARRGVVHGAALLAVVLMAGWAASSALALRSDGGAGPVAQLKLLRLYDLVGAVATEPALPLDRLTDDAPDLEGLIRTDGVRLYSPQRNDTLVGSQKLQDELADAPSELMARQWSDLILKHLPLYLRVRANVFRWVFLTPDIVACRPVFTGVEGPAGEMQTLGIAARMRPRDLALANYAKAFMGTPVFSHAAFALLGLIVLVVLLTRRRPGDIAMAFLSIAGFAFAASFFAISIACDYRYLYFLDMAALSGAFYLALDPAYLFQVLAMWSGSSWVLRSAERKS